MVSGHWIFTPNLYVCMGFDSSKINKTQKGKALETTAKLLEIRKLDGTVISRLDVITNKNNEYGISAGGSMIILNEVGDDEPKLRVFGP